MPGTWQASVIVMIKSIIISIILFYYYYLPLNGFKISTTTKYPLPIAQYLEHNSHSLNTY